MLSRGVAIITPTTCSMKNYETHHVRHGDKPKARASHATSHRSKIKSLNVYEVKPISNSAVRIPKRAHTCCDASLHPLSIIAELHCRSRI